MTFGQIAGNRSINAMIYRCFQFLNKDDQRRFVKKFREQPDDSDQIMHTFRELILGAYLSSAGYSVIHDYVINDKTPDWTIFDCDRETILAIVELTNFHIDKATEDEIGACLRAGSMAVYWRDHNTDNVNRLYQVICDKASKYRRLVGELHLPYVVSVFGEFAAAVDFEEVCRCLSGGDEGLFGLYPELSGLLYFDENGGMYSFRYAGNPDALHKIDLPEGVFPPGEP